MKTLDEVIKAMDHVEFCCTNCKLQFDCDEVECFLEDALFYLKDYQRYQNTPSRNGHMALVDYFEEQQKNEPLTMKDFSQMIDTEPIWCQELQEWYLFLAYDDGDNRIQLMTDKGDIETFEEDELEKYPLYRKK